MQSDSGSSRTNSGNSSTRSSTKSSASSPQINDRQRRDFPRFQVVPNPKPFVYPDFNNVDNQNFLLENIFDYYGIECNSSITLSFCDENYVLPAWIKQELKHVAQCIKAKNQFVVVNLIIKTRKYSPGKEIYHANLLIVNSKNKEITHFEPHGLAKSYITPCIVAMNAELSRLLKTTYRFVANTMPKQCQLMGVQQTKNDLHIDERRGQGTCYWWNMLFLEFFLSTPKIPAQEVYEYFIRRVTDYSSNSLLTNYIAFVAGLMEQPTTRIPLTFRRLTNRIKMNDKAVSRRAARRGLPIDPESAAILIGLMDYDAFMQLVTKNQLHNPENMEQLRSSLDRRHMNLNDLMQIKPSDKLKKTLTPSKGEGFLEEFLQRKFATPPLTAVDKIEIKVETASLNPLVAAVILERLHPSKLYNPEDPRNLKRLQKELVKREIRWTPFDVDEDLYPDIIEMYHKKKQIEENANALDDLYLRCLLLMLDVDKYSEIIEGDNVMNVPNYSELLKKELDEQDLSWDDLMALTPSAETEEAAREIWGSMPGGIHGILKEIKSKQ